MKHCIHILGALAIATSLTFAQDEPQGPKGPKGPGGPGGPGKRPNPEEIFKKLDADSNGSLSLEEFKASPRAQKDPDKAEQAFKKMDADSDGGVTLEEFKKARPPRGPGGPGKGRGPGQGGGGGNPPPPPAE